LLCSYPLCMSFVSFFFFQAEDGIRDFHVTGVQTCALPISLLLGLRETRIERQHLGARRMVLAQGFDAFADLAFAGQENQYVSGTMPGTLAHSIHHGVDEVAFFVAPAACAGATFVVITHYRPIT